MTKLSFGGAAPTMIVPGGTQIRVDAHGQLSIRTPGNLVLQNSGSYGVLESVSGSIRIEPGVQVEAVTVRCADTCYVQGNLVAWRVVARTLHIDGDAEVHVVMQETERLEVGRNARLVGNFRSEQELFGVFARFARQVRSLPFALSDGEASAEVAAESPGPVAGVPDHERPTESAAAAARLLEAKAPTEARTSDEQLPEDLFFALVLLEREVDRSRYGPSARRILSELVKLLRERDLETLRHTHRTLFGRITEAGEDLRRSARLVAGFFDRTEGAE